jgi:hypothetical protein
MSHFQQIIFALTHPMVAFGKHRADHWNHTRQNDLDIGVQQVSVAEFFARDAFSLCMGIPANFENGLLTEFSIEWPRLNL